MLANRCMSRCAPAPCCRFLAPPPVARSLVCYPSIASRRPWPWHLEIRRDRRRRYSRRSPGHCERPLPRFETTVLRGPRDGRFLASTRSVRPPSITKANPPSLSRRSGTKTTFRPTGTLALRRRFEMPLPRFPAVSVGGRPIRKPVGTASRRFRPICGGTYRGSNDESLCGWVDRFVCQLCRDESVGANVGDGSFAPVRPQFHVPRLLTFEAQRQ